MAAGAAEETCALAVPLWLTCEAAARATGTRARPDWRSASAGPCWVILRIAYHAYLGPVALSMTAWAVMTVVLYLRMGRLLPLSGQLELSAVLTGLLVVVPSCAWVLLRHRELSAQGARPWLDVGVR